MNNAKLQALPLLASMLGDKLGVNVVIGEKQNACTDGSTIHLPALPINSDEVMGGLVNGYIDHEAAHIRYTDFELLKQSSMTPLEAHVCNTFEDWRVEQEIIKRYPGCQYHFEWLIRHMFLKKNRRRRKAEGDPPSAFVIPNYALLTVRAWTVPELCPTCQKESDVINEKWPGLKNDLDSILERVQMMCRTTLDSINFAQEFVRTIESYTQKLSESDMKNKENLYQENAQELSPSEGTDSSSSSENILLTKEENSIAVNPKQQLETLIQAGENELPQGLERLISQAIGSGRKKEKASAGIAQVIKMETQPLAKYAVSEAMASSRAMRTRLQSLLQARTLKRSWPSRHGRTDGRMLHRIAIHNPRLFRKNEAIVGMSTAVHILLDISGSMSKRIELACMACYSVASALSTIPGISVGVSVFPADTTAFSPSICPIVRHGERVSNLFGIEAGGTTPLTEALWWVMRQIVSLPLSRKIILVITDGYPDDFQTAEETIAALGNLGVEIRGIGIDAPFLYKLISQQENIQDIRGLAPAMFRILQETL